MRNFATFTGHMVIGQSNVGSCAHIMVLVLL